MINGTFPRHHVSIREGATLVGRWDIGASGAATKVANRSHPGLVLTRVSDGHYRLDLTGGCRVLHPVGIIVGQPDTDDPLDWRGVNIDEEAGGVDDEASTGRVYFHTYKGGVTSSSGTIVDPITGSVIYVTVIAAK